MSDVREHEWDQEADHLISSEKDDADEQPEWAITEGTLDMGIGSKDHIGVAINDETRRVMADVKAEQAIHKQIDLSASLVDTNYSGHVRFKTVTVGPPNVIAAVRLVDNKDLRGDTVITVQSGGPVYIGSDINITAGGANTAAIPSGGARVVRTRDEIWCVAAVAAVVDVVEEFS